MTVIMVRTMPLIFISESTIRHSFERRRAVAIDLPGIQSTHYSSPTLTTTFPLALWLNILSYACPEIANQHNPGFSGLQPLISILELTFSASTISQHESTSTLTFPVSTKSFNFSNIARSGSIMLTMTNTLGVPQSIRGQYKFFAMQYAAEKKLI